MKLNFKKTPKLLEVECSAVWIFYFIGWRATTRSLNETRLLNFWVGDDVVMMQDHRQFFFFFCFVRFIFLFFSCMVRVVVGERSSKFIIDLLDLSFSILSRCVCRGGNENGSASSYITSYWWPTDVNFIFISSSRLYLVARLISFINNSKGRWRTNDDNNDLMLLQLTTVTVTTTW
jgi:hypothetical protein